jgi:hypothetical protein
MLIALSDIYRNTYLCLTKRIRFNNLDNLQRRFSLNNLIYAALHQLKCRLHFLSHCVDLGSWDYWQATGKFTLRASTTETLAD